MKGRCEYICGKEGLCVKGRCEGCGHRHPCDWGAGLLACSIWLGWGHWGAGSLRIAAHAAGLLACSERLG